MATGFGSSLGGLAGAALGYVFPSVGTAVGGFAGSALGGGLEALGSSMFGGGSGGDGTNQGGFWTGQPGRLTQKSRFTPQQMDIQNQLLTMAMQGLRANPLDFAPIEAYARKQFQEQTVPSLAERFTSMTHGAMSSPQLMSQLSSAGADLEAQLAAMRGQYGLQAQGALHGLLGLGLEPQENIYMAGQPGAAHGILGGLAQALPGAISSYLQSRQLEQLLAALSGAKKKGGGEGE